MLRRLAQPAGQRGHDRALVGGGEVGAPLRERFVVQVAHGVEERGLDPREGEVEPGHARDRERERLGVAHAGEGVDRGAARVAEAEQPRALVERLAGCVVERRPEPLRTTRDSLTASSSVWPPLASRQVKGGSRGSGPR